MRAIEIMREEIPAAPRWIVGLELYHRVQAQLPRWSAWAYSYVGHYIRIRRLEKAGEIVTEMRMGGVARCGARALWCQKARRIA